ncbi:hypothetical protein RJI07_06165 [Mycoplasmatota bacterium WC30]
MKNFMKQVYLRVKLLYLISFVISFVSAYLYYKYAYVSHTDINVTNISIIFVPAIFLALSIVFDINIYKEEFNKTNVVATSLFLPLFFSLHLIILTIGSISYSSETQLFWYILLIIPIFIVAIFAYLTYKYLNEKKNAFLTIKYILSLILYIYGIFIWYTFLFLLSD